jgi:hypothetical protein
MIAAGFLLHPALRQPTIIAARRGPFPRAKLIRSVWGGGLFRFKIMFGSLFIAAVTVSLTICAPAVIFLAEPTRPLNQALMAGIFLLALLVAARFAPYNHGARPNAFALHSKPYPRYSGGHFLSARFGISFAFIFESARQRSGVPLPAPKFQVARASLIDRLPNYLID